MNITVRVEGYTILTTTNRVEAEETAHSAIQMVPGSVVEIVTVERIRPGVG